MSVNGKPDEGDVYLEEDGYMVCHLKNNNGCSYRLYLAPEGEGNTMWLSDASTAAYCKGEKIMNIKELLLAVREDLKDEPSH